MSSGAQKPVVGSFVKWESGNITSRGQVTEITNGGTKAKIQPVEKDASIVTKDVADIEVSNLTGLRMNATANLLEVAENVVANSLVLRAFGHDFTGPSLVLQFRTYCTNFF